MAKYYQATYQKLIRKILSGNLVHVDETEVKLKTGKGYVWVFTNLEEVVYMYRPNREGEFLRKLLKDFKGVLVSDFYAAYDAMDCPQQKCLIHLIRDLNQELLDNPFDEELKLITQKFGSMLRRIIATIDKHGLKRKYLKQHDEEVAEFFKLLMEQKIYSESAEAIKVRMTKYRDKLFTFLKYDGIPWNNNNAEHAIKQFAYYREHNDGSIIEKGLNEYLALLSIYQSCKYKRINFLQFLLSKKKDIDDFGKRKPKKRYSTTIELYPKGFIPSHFSFREREKMKKQLEKANDLKNVKK